MGREQPTVTVDVDAHPTVATIHGITRGQKLRVVMKLPAGPIAYEKDAVVLDAGDGVPIILWAYQTRAV